MVKERKSVAVIGLGYLGLTTAVCFTDRGFPVTGVEADARKLASLNKGVSTIHEPLIPELLAKAVKSKEIRFVGSVHQAGDPDFVFITVGTPSKADGSIDLSYVGRAAREVGALLRRNRKYRVVVVKSSTVPGTTMSLVKPVLESESRCNVGMFGLCYSPEFIREGKAVADTFQPDKLVLGGVDKRSTETVLSLYKNFYGHDLPRVIETTPSNAEMIKYASNSFLAMKVSYVNQVAKLCAAIPGCDVTVVADAIGLDKRIGRRFLDAGLGFGGSCFSKDLRALRSVARERGVSLPLVDATLRVNDDAAMAAIDGIESVLGKLGGRRVAILGLAFKPGTDDMRDAVSLRIIPELKRSGAHVTAYDPVSEENAKELLRGVKFANSASECITGADCAIIVTEWDEFRRLEPALFKKRMRYPFVFDGRRVYDPSKFRKAGIRFRAVGLGTTSR